MYYLLFTNMSKVNFNSKYKTSFNNSLSHFIHHNRSHSNIYDSCSSINSYNQNSILQNYNKNKPQKKEMSFTNKSLLNTYCESNNNINKFHVSSSFLNTKTQFDISTIYMKTKLKQKLIDINDIIFNNRRKSLHNNLKRSSSLECKAKDILKYSASQRFIFNSDILKKYKDKKIKESFRRNNIENNNIKLSWKKNEIEHYQYINDINRIAFNKNKM